MASTTLLSDNGVTSGITGYTLTGGNDGTLQLQTTTAGGTATTAVTIDNSQNMGLGVTPSASSLKSFEIGYAGNALLGWGANDVDLVCGAYYNGGWKYAATNSLGASHYEQYNGAHYWAGVAPTSHTAGDTPAFATNMVLNATGALSLKGASASANGVGITFPATQAPSTNAKTLDDYEEGTWTVATNGSGNLSSITFTVAKYIKIGRLVQVQIGATYSTSGSGNTYVVFSLPFSMDTAGSTQITGSLTVYNVGSNFSSNTGCIVDNSSGDATYAFGGWYVPSTATSQSLTICMTYQAST